MELIIPTLMNILINTTMILLALYLEKKARFQKLPYWGRQLVFGMMFGCVSAIASGYGISWMGTVLNVRDAAPISAGLLFGAPAGIIAGMLGGIYRWASVLWGAGTYTRVACTLATIISGIVAACSRRLIQEDKLPSWAYGASVGVVCEVLHMLLVFLTNMENASYAFSFVRGAAIPMIIGNALAVSVGIIAVLVVKREPLLRWGKTVQISQTFQRELLACICLAFLGSGIVTYSLQNSIAKIEVQEVFAAAIDDTVADIREKSDENLLTIADKIRRSYLQDKTRKLNDLAKAYGVTEINIVDPNGEILASTDKSLVGNFNMWDSEQSREFMALTEDTTKMVQSYGPVGSDQSTMRKFAGLKLVGGGLIQVGFDADQFHDSLDAFVVEVTKNRRVGTDGFLVVCNEELNMVTDNDRNGEHISTTGIRPNEEMLEGTTATKLYNTQIINQETGLSEAYVYVFTFVESYCIIAAMPVEEAMFLRDASLYTSLFMQVLIFATLYIFIFFMVKRVILNNMGKINRGLARITNGDLNEQIDVRTNLEFSALSDDINSTVDTLKKYIAEAEARIDRELEYAKQIQLAALPTKFPQNAPYRIFAQMIAAREVGGDFYDFYKLDENRVAFLVADVSGKGIPAAMFMMSAKATIKDLAESNLPAHEIFAKANDRLCENNEADMFVTAWMGILDLSTGVLTFANAGHNPPLLMRCGAPFTYLRGKADIPLAFLPGRQYTANSLQLNPGDRIFLYTDGVTEAMNAHKKLYGEGRLADYLNGHREATDLELLPALKADIDAYAGEEPQSDDITMLMFSFDEKRGEKS